MNQNLTDKAQAIRYFLGELSEKEQSAVEKLFFENEGYSRFLDAVEEDLIRDYIGDKLEAEQKRNFELHFLISRRRREAVRRARLPAAKTLAGKENSGGFGALKTSLRQLKESSRISYIISASKLAAISLFILLGIFWLVRPPGKIETNRIENKNQKQIIKIAQTPAPEILLPAQGVQPPETKITIKLRRIPLIRKNRRQSRRNQERKKARSRQQSRPPRQKRRRPPPKA
jgi:hypothetical protein